MAEPIRLRELQGEEYYYNDSTQTVEEYAEFVGIPSEHIVGLSGVVVNIIDGEFEEIYFTESNRPFDLNAVYYDPTYWTEGYEEGDVDFFDPKTWYDLDMEV